MLVRVEMYKIVSRNFLVRFFEKSFSQSKGCYGICCCCLRRDAILNESENKGFKTFNSKVKYWKLVDNLNRFEIFPLFSGRKKYLKNRLIHYLKKQI